MWLRTALGEKHLDPSPFRFTEIATESGSFNLPPALENELCCAWMAGRSLVSAERLDIIDDPSVKLSAR